VFRHDLVKGVDLGAIKEIQVLAEVQHEYIIQVRSR
jgi:hypothetical protein